MSFTNIFGRGLAGHSCAHALSSYNSNDAHPTTRFSCRLHTYRPPLLSFALGRCASEGSEDKQFCTIPCCLPPSACVVCVTSTSTGQGRRIEIGHALSDMVCHTQRIFYIFNNPISPIHRLNLCLFLLFIFG